MRTYTSSRAKRKRFHRKSGFRMFFVDFRSPLVYQSGTPTWRLHTKLYKVASNVSANNSETVSRTDLRLGEIVYV